MELLYKKAKSMEFDMKNKLDKAIFQLRPG